MKKIFYFITFMAFTFVSCQQLDFDEDFQTATTNSSTNSKFNVSLSDVKFFMNILDKNDSLKQVGNITPIVFKQDTLFYIVNYANKKGWALISGDKRTPAILASDTVGILKESSINPGLGTWTEDLAEHLLALKQTDECDSTATDFIMWKNISSLQNNKPSKILAPTENEGYYELVDVTSEILPSIQVGPLTKTQWGQRSPWNSCVPYYEYNNPERALTGCVAVAGCQMLYYLHYKLGAPVTANTTGYMDGIFFDRDNYTINYSFGNPSSTVWDNMALNKYSVGTDYVAILMGEAGLKLDMNWGGDASGAPFSNLQNLLNVNGINSTLCDYNTSTVTSSLNNNYPVMISAYADKRPHTFIITWYYSYHDGHAWIIDGYETKRTKYTYYYQWIPTDNNGITPIQQIKRVPDLPVENLVKIETSISSTQYWIMNWGWNGDYNSGRYLSSGNIWSAGGYDFQYEKEMIFNYSKK